MHNGKTYLAAAILGTCTVLRFLDIISQEQFELIMGLAGTLGLAGLRHGIQKLGE